MCKAAASTNRNFKVAYPEIMNGNAGLLAQIGPVKYGKRDPVGFVSIVPPRLFKRCGTNSRGVCTHVGAKNKRWCGCCTEVCFYYIVNISGLG